MTVEFAGDVLQESQKEGDYMDSFEQSLNVNLTQKNLEQDNSGVKSR